MKRSRQRIEVNLPELDAVLDRALQQPLSDPDYQKLKTALHALADLATPARTTEKTESVLAEAGVTPSSEDKPGDKKPARKPGHGRNGADAFSGSGYDHTGAVGRSGGEDGVGESRESGRSCAYRK